MTPDCPITRAEVIGSASLAMGAWSVLTCWWYPFGVFMGCAGVILAVAGLSAGASIRAPLGLFLSLVGASAGLLLNWGAWRASRADDRRPGVPMAQTFPRWFDTASRAGLLGSALFVPTFAVGLMAFYRSDYVTGAHTARRQPVPFSHAHHVGQLGIDCRYCHTSVESAAFAGMPATETCMNCHQQMWVGAPTLEPVRASWKSGQPLVWTRMHNLPQFVYFRHDVHLAKGVGCIVCHGRIDRMPLTWQVQPLSMEWCISCHRDPAPHLRPRKEVFNMTWSEPGFPAGNPESARMPGDRPPGKKLAEEYHVRDERTLTSCSFCHR